MRLTEQQCKFIVWEDCEEFELVEEIVDFDTMYKDYADCEVIFKTQDGKFYRFNYQQYQSHYGSGEHMFEEQDAVEVEAAEKITIEKYWKRKE